MRLDAYLKFFLYCLIFFVHLYIFPKELSKTNISKKLSTNFIISNKNKIFRNSEFDLGIVLFMSVSADSVYSYLYKFPLLGGVNLGYTYKTKDYRHGFNLRGGIGRLYSPYSSSLEYTPIDDMAFQFNLRYTSAFRIWKSETLILLLGPGAHFSGNGWIPDDDSLDVLRYTWSLHSGVGVYLNLIWEANSKHQLSGSIYTSIIGVAWRPTYSGYTLKEESLLETKGMLATLFSNSRFISFHNFLRIDFRMNYEYLINTFIALEVEYYGLLEYIAFPRDRLELQNNIIGGISFRW